MLVALVIAAGAAFSQSAFAAGPELRPLALAPADVSLYLRVMRATALRLRQPTADDRAVQARADAAQSRQRKAYDAFASSHAGGVAPTRDEIAALKASDPDAAERAAIARTTTLRLQPDILVARELQVDERRYSRIRDTVERIVRVPDEDADEDADADADRPPSVAAPVRTPGAQELMDQAVSERNAAVLKPHQAEIRKLLKQVGRRREVD